MSKWAVRHPIWAIVLWVVGTIVVISAAIGFGGKFNDSFELPGVQSTTAQQLLEKLPGAGTNNTSIKIVWSPTSGRADDEKTYRALEPLFTRLADMEHVECVQTPFARNFGSKCSSKRNENLTAAVMGEINRVLVAKTGLDVAQANEAAQALQPLADANPATLASIAALLPDIAKIAQIPQKDLDDASSLIKLLKKYIPGVDAAKLNDLQQAIGDIREFNDRVPASVRDALAKTDPATLSRIARSLPADAAKIRALDAELNDAVDRLRKAAVATERATAQISTNGDVGFATMTVKGASLSQDEALAIWDAVSDANSAELQVGAQGSALEGADSGPDYSELIGLGAAIIILLIAFGSFVAAGLPIVTAISGIVVGQLLVVVVAHFTNVPSFAPTLALMIGLGVGIDYALFILNRFREGIQAGLDPKSAAEKSVGTAGRAVLFAGSTVILALLGMFVLRIEFFNGLALAAAVSVLMVMMSALLLLPALLSVLGIHALGLRLPWRRTLPTIDLERSKWAAYGRLLQKAPIVPALLALALIGVLAWPATTLRLGFPDDGTQAQGTPLRTGYDLMAKGFGDGVNGPFFVAVEVDKKDDFSALRDVMKALEETPGVSEIVPNQQMLPLLELDKTVFGDGGRVTSIIVYPKTGPQAAETAALLDTIRDSTQAKISNAKIFVGGSQAVSTDFTMVLQGALPLFLLLVLGMGFLALLLLFRSIVIPVTAAITSLLSFFASLGVTVAIFQLGIADSIFGVTGTGPILPFLPIMVFAILFGLSMDYQVFLVSRMQEEWLRRSDNRDAVRFGLAGSGKVVVIAATIMSSVFLAFVPTPNDTIKLFGIALASSVLIDAFVVRLVLVPSVMSLLGRANWWLPKWLDRVLPKFQLE